jgi:hypothetical protein
MPQPSQADLMRQYQETLEAFVLRARRVAQHSLAADPEVLLDLAKGKSTLEHEHATGKKFLTRSLPEEEVVESAAARVRPILLSSEPVHWGKALKAISFLGRGKNGFDDEAVRDLKEVWKRVQPGEGAARAYTLLRQGKPDEAVVAATDNVLGLSWFYGDVVHADTDRRAAGVAFGINERYRAAVMLVAIAMVTTKMTLNLILKMRKDGILDMPDGPFEEDVVVSETEVRQETEFFVGPVGTPLPTSPFSGSPEGFEPFNPDEV